MGSRYRHPEEVRLELEGGDWLLVKKHLTAGETRDGQIKIIKSLATQGRPAEFNLEHLGIAQAIFYLLDWNLTDADDRPIVIRDKSYEVVFDALRNQTPESQAEILEAIQAHDAKMTAEREEQKKMSTGGPSPSLTFKSAE